MAASLKHHSQKRKIIDKTNSTIVIAISFTTFIIIFSLFSIRALYGQSTYNSRVVTEKEKALEQLSDNRGNIALLQESYEAFIGEQINIIGGNPTGNGPLDGDNKKLVLDSLPVEYNFTGLSSSIEKILKDGGYVIDELGGREDSSLGGSASSSSNSIPISYTFTARADTAGTRNLFETLERSIRPFNVRGIEIVSDESTLRTTVTLTTYYSPEKIFEVGKKVVR
jgi:hypothetical protein